MKGMGWHATQRGSGSKGLTFTALDKAISRMLSTRPGSSSMDVTLRRDFTASREMCTGPTIVL
jgi:hypothetical protein